MKFNTKIAKGDTASPHIATKIIEEVPEASKDVTFFFMIVCALFIGLCITFAVFFKINNRDWVSLMLMLITASISVYFFHLVLKCITLMDNAINGKVYYCECIIIDRGVFHPNSLPRVRFILGSTETYECTMSVNAWMEMCTNNISECYIGWIKGSSAHIILP